MSKFVNFNKEFNLEINFWEQNPQLILMTPWNRLYNLDGGGMYSSKLAWTVYFVSDPDESENKFYKFGKAGIEEMLAETYFNNQPPDWENEAYLACIESYPDQHLSAVGSAYALKKNFLVKMGTFLNEQTLDMENVKDISMVLAKVPKLYEDFEKIEEKFFKNKHTSRVKGGRNQSKAEKNEI